MTNVSQTYSVRSSAVRGAKRANISNPVIVEVEGGFAYVVPAVFEEASAPEVTPLAAETTVKIAEAADALKAVQGDDGLNVPEISLLQPVPPAPPAPTEIVPPAPVVTHGEAPVAMPFGPETKKAQLLTMLRKEALTVQMISDRMGITLTAARGLIGDLQRHGFNLVVVRQAGSRMAYYSF